MSFTILPPSSTNMWPQTATVAGSSSPSPEAEVDQLEREANEQAQHLPEAQRAAYRTMVRREITQIRTLIIQMRAQGFQENAINGAISGLTQKFYESKNRFLGGNEKFAINKSLVCARNQATANKIRQCTPDFSPIARISIDDEEDDTVDQSFGYEVKEYVILTTSSHESSPPPVDMETKKTQIAQCVQMEDPEAPGSAALCVAHHLKGLSETQQQTLLDFVPKAYVGHGANSVAAPFAAVSMAVKTVTKAIFQGAVSESCSEQHRGDLHGFRQCLREQNDVFTGQDPQFNKTIVAETPKVVKKAVVFLARINGKLEALDTYMYEQYRTIPGIIHEGVYGMITTSPVVPFAIVRIANTALHGIKFSASTATSPITRNIIHFAKDEAGSVKLPLIICKDMTEVKAIVTAEKVKALAKPWAHEQPLTVNAARKAQDLAEIAKGIAKKYTSEELTQRQLVIRDGLVYQGSSGEVLHTSGNVNIVLRKDGTLLADYKVQPDGSWSYHSALCENPIAAGNASFNFGRISYLDEGSGHFLPFDRLQYIEFELKSRGAQFTEDFYKLTAQQLSRM